MSAEVVARDEVWARRITERIRYSALGVRDGLEKLQSLMTEAQAGNAHEVLGYASWTAYISEVMGEEPLRLARDERRDLVAWLSGQGMSTRAIAPIVGVHHDTVATDIKASAPVGNPTPAPVEAEGYLVNPSTGEVLDNTEAIRGALQDAEDRGNVIPITGPGSVGAPQTTEHTFTEKVKTVTGLDGKEYRRPEPSTPRRRSLVDDAMKARHDLWAAISQIQTIMQDDRYKQNKADIQDAIHPATRLANEVFANLFDNKESEQI